MAERGQNHEDFAALIDHRDLIVCAGSGGVGKTTTSAVIGLHAALRGKKVLVLTIDPAKRLANSLGVNELGNQAQQIPLEPFLRADDSPRGELWAMMLDMKASFDDLVRRHAPSPQNEREILENRFYQYFSTSLAGTQEYAAAERLYELHRDGEYDLIILDTPPTTHALDFLEAPNRLASAVENKALQWLYKPTLLNGKSGLGLFSVGTSYIINTLGRFTGAELLNDMATFLRAFSTLFEGLQDRARRVQAMLSGDDCTFVVVTAPDPLTVEEALFFWEELGHQKVAVGGFVVNRVHPHWAQNSTLALKPKVVAEMLEEMPNAPQASAQETLEFAQSLLENAREFETLATIDEHSVHSLSERVPRETPIVTVPYFSRDIHSLEGLLKVRDALFR